MAHRTAPPAAAAEHRPRTELEALAEAARAFVAKPSYSAYTALIAHYRGCHGCAYNTAPCTQGKDLRQAWKAVRWS